MKKVMLCLICAFALFASSCFADQYVYEHGMYKYKKIEGPTSKVVSHKYVHENGVYKYKPYVVERDNSQSRKIVYDKGLWKLENVSEAHH